METANVLANNCTCVNLRHPNDDDDDDDESGADDDGKEKEKTELPILIALTQGNIDVAECLLDNGVSVNVTDEMGITPLHAAAIHGHEKFAKILLKKGACINAKAHGMNWSTPLHCAVQEGQVDVTRLLLRKGANLHAVVRDTNFTPLQLAVSSDQLDCFKLLLSIEEEEVVFSGKPFPLVDLAVQKGSLNILEWFLDNGYDMHVINNEGMNLLHVAADAGQESAVQFLLYRCADVNSMTEEDSRRTALHIAAFRGDTTLCKFLLDKGAKIDGGVQDKLKSPIFCAIKNYQFETFILLERCYSELNVHMDDEFHSLLLHTALSYGNEKVFTWLLKKGTEVDLQESHEKFPLHRAVCAGNKELTHDIIKTGTSVNYFDNGWTALHEAVYNGRLEMVQLLIAEGAHISSMTADGRSVLHLAALGGQLECLKFLANFENDLMMDGRDRDGNTPLHLAAAIGHEDIVCWILDKGLSVNIVNKDGLTPLCYSLFHVEVAVLLLDRGAYVNIGNSIYEGITLLHSATGARNVDMVKLLIERGADTCKYSILDHEAPIHWAVKLEDFDCLKAMADLGCDLSLRMNNETGNTPAHLAIACGNMMMIDWFLNNGISIEMNNEDGMSLIHMAVKVKKVDVVKFLIRRGANVNSRTQNLHGSTPLHIATHNGHVEMIELLLSSGADPNLMTLTQFETPMHSAVKRNDISCLEALVNGGGNIRIHLDDSSREPLLITAIRLEKYDAFLWLIDNGVPVNFKTKGGLTPLHYAALVENIDIAEVLVENEARLNVQAEDHFMMTPLHIAVERGDYDMTELLVEEGADYSLLTQDKKTAVHIAAQQGDLGCLKLLAKVGADLMKQILTRTGQRPIHLAAVRGHTNVVEWLLNKGVPVDTFNSLRQTPLHCACFNGHVGTASLLLDRGASVDAGIHTYGNEPGMKFAQQEGYLQVLFQLLRRGVDAERQMKKDSKILKK